MKKQNVALVILGIVSILLVAAAGFMVSRGVEPRSVKDHVPSNQMPCTNEAKLCPDGSAVGREGEKCEFPECPDETPAKPE